jgi:hypothetical protein
VLGLGSCCAVSSGSSTRCKLNLRGTSANHYEGIVPSCLTESIKRSICRGDKFHKANSSFHGTTIVFGHRDFRSTCHHHRQRPITVLNGLVKRTLGCQIALTQPGHSCTCQRCSSNPTENHPRHGTIRCDITDIWSSIHCHWHQEQMVLLTNSQYCSRIAYETQAIRLLFRGLFNQPCCFGGYHHQSEQGCD